MPTTLTQLIDNQRAQLQARLDERKTHSDTIEKIRAALAEDEQRTELTDEETRATQVAVEARRAIDADVETLRARLTDLEAEQRADESATRLAEEIGKARGDAGDEHRGSAVVTGEARTYTPETARGGVSFFGDAFRSQFLGDLSARQRLERHSTEVRVEREKRAGTSASFGSLTVPQYLTNLVAMPIRNGRPVANLIPSQPLPEQGLSLTVPRVTTGTAVAAQATQNTAVQNTDAAVTDLPVPVVTISGQQDVSRQLLERGTPGIDQIIYRDLAAAYAAELDRQVVYGTGTGNTMLGLLQTAGILASTAFGATVSVANFYLKLGGIIAAITGQGAGIIPDLIAMHPRRWGWLTGQTDNTQRPLALATQNGPYNATALNLAPGMVGSDADPIDGATIVGSIHGLPVVTDPNLPANVGTNSEDLLAVFDTSKQLLWEDSKAPKELRFDQTLAGQLTIKLVVYGYAAFTAGRYPTSIGKVGGLDATGGQGLVAPSF